jgi:hypothetical protein
MPAYETTQPPQSLYPGDIFYAFGSVIRPGPSVASGQPPFTTGDPTITEVGETIGAARASERCALSQPQAASESGGRAITWEAEFDAVPTAATMTLEGAMRDVDAEYVTLDTNAVIGVVATKSKMTYGVRQLFLRLRLTAVTAGPATTMIGKILG